jgi:hypothetical protein
MFATGLAAGAALAVGLTRAALAGTARLTDALAAVGPLAAPAPGGTIDTSGVVSFIASKVAPILLAVLGIIFIGRASKGEVSKVLTSSAIAIVGLAFIAGAATLFFVGESLVNVFFK